MNKVEVFTLGDFSITLNGEDILSVLGNSKKKDTASAIFADQQRFQIYQFQFI